MLITNNVYQFDNTDLPWKNIKTSKPLRYVRCLVMYESREYYSGDVDLQFCCAFFNGCDFMEDCSPFGSSKKLNMPVAAFVQLSDLKKPRMFNVKERTLF